MMIFKAPWEIDLMRKSSRIVAEALNKLAELIEPGLTTIELDRFAEAYILRRGGKPAFKGYRGYPYTLCVSVNDQVVHGFPSTRRLENGDIISLDLGVVVDGYYGDAAVTIPVGTVTGEARRLIAATQGALSRAISAVRIGNHLSDISHAVQSAIEAQGFSVVRLFVGHGIGRSLHEEPQIPNFGPAGQGPILKPGLVLAVERRAVLELHALAQLEGVGPPVGLDLPVGAQQRRHRAADVDLGEPFEHVVVHDLADRGRRAGGRIEPRRFEHHREHDRVLGRLRAREAGGQRARQRRGRCGKGETAARELHRRDS